MAPKVTIQKPLYIMDILLYFILPTLTLALGTLSFISLKRFFRTIKTELKTGKENKQQIEIYTKLWKETQNEYAREKAYILLLEDYALDVDKIFRYTFLAGVLFYSAVQFLLVINFQNLYMVQKLTIMKLKKTQLGQKETFIQMNGTLSM
jgi:hypothetical protein